MLTREDLSFKSAKGITNQWWVSFRDRQIAFLAERSSPAKGFTVKFVGSPAPVVCPDITTAMTTILNSLNN